MKTDSIPSTETVKPLGQALKDAREGASLSIEEAASQLNLSTTTVRDLEDDLDDIFAQNKYPLIYLRGYLVNYAKLLHFTELGKYSEFQQLECIQKEKKILKASPLMLPRTNKRSFKIPLLLVFILLLIGIVYQFQHHFFSAFDSVLTPEEQSLIKTHIVGPNETIPPIQTAVKLPIAQKVSATLNTAVTPVIAPSLVPSIIPSAIPSIAPQVTPTVVPTAPINDVKEVIEAESEAPVTDYSAINEQHSEPQNTQNASFDAFTTAPSTESEENSSREPEAVIEEQVEEYKGPEELYLSFMGDCWTEIFDATGKRIAFGLYKNGRVLMLKGTAPFQLKLGDPSVVEIQYHDQIIEGEFTPGRSAQFSVPLS
ncbi:hypothetical protein CW745_01050 [Psychromonas sp. psych-6C06]|uniref:RodZ domain-containing protein n=1 Tax=Psychromonas sp. psych-6C06 TaxID=2058089 RepID=UPI000C34881F|nr:RodZ domain-containing protein [Psychromonas sp. psych-6C06]PKF63466.1 hypothetical protein CW745_01050 [Psychromonas sp. psych-6C06]